MQRGIRLFKSWTLVRLRGSGGWRVRAHLYTAVYRYIRPLSPPPPQRIAAQRRDPGLRPMWHPLRSDPAQTSGCALPHPRPQAQVRLSGVGRPPLPMTALEE